MEDGTQVKFTFNQNNEISGISHVIPDTWDPITNSRIEELHPSIRSKAAVFVNRAESELGIRLRIFQGMRTIAEQDELYSQGRTAPGNIVTNAKGGQSFHNYGLAQDASIQVKLFPDFAEVADELVLEHEQYQKLFLRSEGACALTKAQRIKISELDSYMEILIVLIIQEGL